MTGILTEQKFISDCRYRVIKSSSLVSVHFREVFSNPYISFFHLLPARASEQGNVIGLVSVYIYIYVCTKKIVIERTRDLIYLKFVVTDFSPKIISPSAGETPVTQRSPCYSAVSALLRNPLPDCSKYSPLCHTHYLTLDQYFTSLFRPDPLPSRKLETNSKFNAAALYCRI